MEHKLILGGSLYLPFARSRIKALRAAGMRYASQRFLFPDGEVNVQIVGEHEYIRLSGQSFNILSGVVRDGEIITGDPDTLHEFKPTLQAWKYPLKKRAGTSTTAFHDEPKLVIEAHADLDASGSQYTEIAASMYSGLMVKAAQLILGYGKYQVVDGVQLRYNFRFDHCHGITIADDGKLWIVEISQARGVLATRLTTIKGSTAYKASIEKVLSESVTLFKGLPTGDPFPSGTALTEGLADGTVIELASASALDPFYTKTAFSPLLGWSFDEQGREARNTCHRTSGGSVYACMYQILISIGETPEDGSAPPASATLNFLEEGRLTRRSAVGLVPANNNPFSFAIALDGEMAPLPAEVVTTDIETDAPILVCRIGGEWDVVRCMNSGHRTDIGTVVTVSDNYATVHPPSHVGAINTTVGYIKETLREDSTKTRYVKSTLFPDEGPGWDTQESRSETVIDPAHPTTSPDWNTPTNLPIFYVVNIGTQTLTVANPTSGVWAHGCRDGYVLAAGGKTITVNRSAGRTGNNLGSEFYPEPIPGDPTGGYPVSSTVTTVAAKTHKILTPSANLTYELGDTDRLIFEFPPALWNYSGTGSLYTGGRYSLRYSGFGLDPQTVHSQSINYPSTPGLRCVGSLINDQSLPANHTYSFIGYI